jgi:hypothetical protein
LRPWKDSAVDCWLNSSHEHTQPTQLRHNSSRTTPVGLPALRKTRCAVLLCRPSVGDSSPPQDTAVSGQLSVVSNQWSVHSKHPLGGRGSRRAERSGQFSVVSGQPKCSPGIPALRPFTHTKPRRTPRLPVAQPFRELITTQQRQASASSPSWCWVLVAWASARVVHHVQSPTGEPLAQADEWHMLPSPNWCSVVPGSAADGCCRLRLSDCFLPRTETISSAFFAKTIKLKPAAAHVIFR